jgi:predicted dehydrogenase
MSPIRLGLIGLSTASASTNWGPTAHLPYLVSEQGKKHYEIVALCNTSVASGEKSRSTYNLPESVKCYDSPAKLAADENVDMVVNITGVETHYDVLKPVLQAGKDVYTELPLASNMEQMKELMALAREKSVKTVFGMQGQTIALTALLKKTIAEGKIGKVLSTTWTASASRLGAEPTDVGLKMFMDRKTGGNLMSVWFLHSKS